MIFAKPSKYKAKVSDKYFLDDGKKYLFIKFELVTPKVIDFIAGQHLSIKVSDSGERRSYSFASTPDVKHGISLMVDISPEGSGSKYLQDLNNGDDVELLMPLGRFVVESEQADKLLFVATGSGIVPLYVMINDLLRNQKEKRPIRLHWGLRKIEDIFWMDNLERLMHEYDNFVFDLALSQPEAEWSLCLGRVQDCISRDLKDLANWEAYLCGSKEMIQDTTELLISKGMSDSVIHYEKFY